MVISLKRAHETDFFICSRLLYPATTMNACQMPRYCQQLSVPLRDAVSVVWVDPEQFGDEIESR